MVGHIFLLKMLHCKIKNKRIHAKENEDLKSGTCLDTESTKVKQEVEETEDLLPTCRICLKYGDISIFINDSEDIPEALSTIGGIEISEDDKFPKFLCQSCNSLLQGAILFRKTAQDSDVILRQKPSEFISDHDDNTHHNDAEYFDYEEEKDSKQNNSYNCKKCDLYFKSFKEYSDHRLSLEHENFRRTCSICKKSYSAVYFEKHLALHNFEAKYMCDICGKKFIVQGQFSRHRLTHFNDFPFKCSLCPYKGRFNESLKMHMRSHTGEKPYQCSQCPSRFVSKSNLNKHMVTHKTDHDYKCETCGRGFNTKRQMDLHYKVDHTGIKDHICNLCGKAFGYRKQMMKHQLKVHKREKFRNGRMPLYLKFESENRDA